MTAASIANLRSLVRDVPDFPKPGIVFKDITPILGNAEAWTQTIALMAEPHRGARVDAIVGIESRGFIFGAALAHALGTGFVPARKPGKLPHTRERASYDLEYGTDSIEMHVDAFPKGARVLIVDDVIATGGTAAAAVELVRLLGGEVVGAAFLIELSFLNGGAKLPGVPVHAVLKY